MTRFGSPSLRILLAKSEEGKLSNERARQKRKPFGKMDAIVKRKVLLAGQKEKKDVFEA
jgi:hypothetical protein